MPAVAAQKPAPTLRMRIIVLASPPGAHLAVQRGKDALLAPVSVSAAQTVFEIALRLGAPLPDGSHNFLGDYAQGTPGDRFVYINAGTLAGQEGSGWTRRAKLKLAGMPRELADAALADGQRVIEARFQGTGRDGGPTCASIKPDLVTWSLV